MNTVETEKVTVNNTKKEIKKKEPVNKKSSATTETVTKKSAAPKSKAAARKPAEKKAPANTNKKGGKAAAPKKAVKEKKVKKDTNKDKDKDKDQSGGADEVNANGKPVRSFKVKLPGSDKYEGRFTGLTPYQAANKALSKYFRETDNITTKIKFEICESTRNSKKNVYEYTGGRQILTNPVVYLIDQKDKDGNILRDSEGNKIKKEIVKSYKNFLEKIKKVNPVKKGGAAKETGATSSSTDQVEEQQSQPKQVAKQTGKQHLEQQAK